MRLSLMTEHHQLHLTEQVSPAEHENALLNSPPPPPNAFARIHNGRMAILSTTKRYCEALEEARRNPHNDQRTFHVRDAAGNVPKETRKVFN